MGKTKRKVTKSVSTKEIHREPPALDPTARETQMVNLAINLAEQQLRDGTASSQVITHYLKIGTMKTKLELEKMKRENELLTAKTENLQASKDLQRLYTEAIAAMRLYSGDDEYDDEEY